MQLEHTFTVPTSPDEAFRLLNDVARVGPCLPGLTVSSVEGGRVSGKLLLRIGPTQVTYRGSATVSGRDAATRSATIDLDGAEARGTGTVRGTILFACVERDEGTQVQLLADLTLTGRAVGVEPAMLTGVADRLLRRFAGALAEEIAAAPPPIPAPAVPPKCPAAPDLAVARIGAQGALAGVEAGADQGPTVLGPPAPRRATPLVAVVAALVLLLWLVRRG